MPVSRPTTLRRDAVDRNGHTHYFVASPLRDVGGPVPEPLHDYIVKERLGGTHGATSRITSMLWDKLYEFVERLQLPHYTTKAQYDTFIRKLSAARLAYDPRLTDVAVPDVHRVPDCDPAVGEPFRVE